MKEKEKEKVVEKVPEKVVEKVKEKEVKKSRSRSRSRSKSRSRRRSRSRSRRRKDRSRSRKRSRSRSRKRSRSRSRYVVARFYLKESCDLTLCLYSAARDQEIVGSVRAQDPVTGGRSRGAARGGGGVVRDHGLFRHTTFSHFRRNPIKSFYPTALEKSLHVLPGIAAATARKSEPKTDQKRRRRKKIALKTAIGKRRKRTRKRKGSGIAPSLPVRKIPRMKR